MLSSVSVTIMIGGLNSRLATLDNTPSREWTVCRRIIRTIGERLHIRYAFVRKRNDETATCLSISDLEWVLIRAISSRIVSGCELAADYFQSTMTCKPPLFHGDSSDLEEVVSSEEAYGAA